MNRLIEPGPTTLGSDREDKVLLRVMVVDDDENLRRSTCLLLKSHSSIEVVCEGADGAEAVSKARKYQPDVIVMDITMPTMNGLEATRIIKREMPGIQVVVVSAHDAGPFLREALSAGASGFITKTEAGERLLTELTKFKPQSPA